MINDEFEELMKTRETLGFITQLLLVNTKKYFRARVNNKIQDFKICIVHFYF